MVLRGPAQYLQVPRSKVLRSTFQESNTLQVQYNRVVPNKVQYNRLYLLKYSTAESYLLNSLGGIQSA